MTVDGRDLRRVGDTVLHWLEPALRHIGWLVAFLLIAPIIGPQGYGLVAFAFSGIAIADLMLIEGATASVLKLDTTDDLRLSTALVSAAAAGIGLSLLLYVIAGAIGAMSDDTEFAEIFRSLSILPALGGLLVVPSALLRRRGRWMPFAVGTGVGVVLGGAAAFVLAMAGAGSWSLVAQIVIQRICGCTVLWSLAGHQIGLTWSRVRFRELIAALDLRAVARAWPSITQHVACMLAASTLGLTAAGLFVFATRLADGFADLLSIDADRRADMLPSAERVGRLLHRASVITLPTALAFAVMPIVLPSLVDVHWWGAVKPAQIFILAVIPATISSIGVSCMRRAASEAGWRSAIAVSRIVVLAAAAPLGLAAMAVASVCHAAVCAATSAWPIRRQLAADWRTVVGGAARPFVGAVSAGGLALVLADRFATLLDPVPLVCLITAAGWLLYLLILGDDPDASRGEARSRLGLRRS